MQTLAFVFSYGHNASMGDSDGKINGKFPIFDDMLTFIWCKMRMSPCDTLIDVVKSFYKAGDIVKSRDLLFRKLPDNSERRVKHRKTDDILRGIYDLMQSLPTEDPPVFAAVDLNNIPFIELSNIDGAALVAQQRTMKDHIASLLADQQQMRSQLTQIVEMLGDSFANKRDASDRSSALQGETGDLYTSVEANASTRRPHANSDVERRTTESLSGGRRENSGTVSAVGRGSERRNRRTEARSSAASPERTDTEMTTRRAATDGDPNRQPPGDHSVREASDEEGFVRVSNRRRPRNRRPIITGSRTGTSLRSVAQARKVRVFVTRLEADLLPSVLESYVREIISDECTVEKLETRFPSYSSFLVTCDYRHMNTILNPEEWQEGVLIKRFYGNGPNRSGDNSSGGSATSANRHSDG